MDQNLEIRNDFTMIDQSDLEAFVFPRIEEFQDKLEPKRIEEAKQEEQHRHRHRNHHLDLGPNWNSNQRSDQEIKPIDR